MCFSKADSCYISVYLSYDWLILLNMTYAKMNGLILLSFKKYHFAQDAYMFHWLFLFLDWHGSDKGWVFGVNPQNFVPVYSWGYKFQLQENPSSSCWQRLVPAVTQDEHLPSINILKNRQKITLLKYTVYF